MDQQVNDKTTIAYIRETTLNFLNKETAGGLILILSTIVALLIANSDWADTYHFYLKDEFFFELTGYFTFGLSLKEWINDGLMVIFFLVAGLELKREIMVGELSSFKKASMPLIAALGGMIVPALIFFSLNIGTQSINGWGIPIATDIAYSLGIIALLGKRIPSQLKIFLVALAIADDLGAILVIALFYSEELTWLYLGISGLILLLLFAMNRFGVKNLIWYILGGLVLWYFFLNSGIHPTIAGVLFAITIPVKPKLDSKILKEQTESNIRELEKTDLDNLDPMQDKRQHEILKVMYKDNQDSTPPLLKLENSLINFNAFFIIPVFAFANAGVKLDVGLLQVITGSLSLGILLGLALGKMLGISLFVLLANKLGISELPAAITWKHIVGLGMIAGIGFTMSLFVTNLAFSDPSLIKISKISILIASLVSAIAGAIILLSIKNKKEVSV